MLNNLGCLTRVHWETLDPDSGGAKAAIIAVFTKFQVVVVESSKHRLDCGFRSHRGRWGFLVHGRGRESCNSALHRENLVD